MIFLLGCAAALTLNLPPAPTNYGFFVWEGPAPRTYTNKMMVGYPKTGSSNFSATISVPTNRTFLALSVTNRQELESDWSNETNSAGSNRVLLTWVWAPPPGPPATNVVTVSGGTNSISFTNPPHLWAVFRLMGSNTSTMTLQENWNWPASWNGIAVWNLPGGPPSLTINVR